MRGARLLRPLHTYGLVEPSTKNKKRKINSCSQRNQQYSGVCSFDRQVDRKLNKPVGSYFFFQSIFKQYFTGPVRRLNRGKTLFARNPTVAQWLRMKLACVGMVVRSPTDLIRFFTRINRLRLTRHRLLHPSLVGCVKDLDVPVAAMECLIT